MGNPLFIVLIVFLVLLAFAGAPGWGYHHFGWYPSGGFGLVLAILLILLLLGRI